MPIAVPGAISPASLAIAQYLAALQHDTELALPNRKVLCFDQLCALTAASCGGTVTFFDTDTRTLEVTQRAAEAQQLSLKTSTLDLKAVAEPLPIDDQTAPTYGTATGIANLVILSDVLADETSAQCLATRVGEAVKLGAWVLLADEKPSCREAFLDLLEVELRHVDCGCPYFDAECAIDQKLSLGWATEVALLRLNSPGYAPALDTGYLSLEERRGFSLPGPVVQVTSQVAES